MLPFSGAMVETSCAWNKLRGALSGVDVGMRSMKGKGNQWLKLGGIDGLRPGRGGRKVHQVNELM